MVNDIHEVASTGDPKPAGWTAWSDRSHQLIIRLVQSRFPYPPTSVSKFNIYLRLYMVFPLRPAAINPHHKANLALMQVNNDSS